MLKEVKEVSLSGKSRLFNESQALSSLLTIYWDAPDQDICSSLSRSVPDNSQMSECRYVWVSLFTPPSHSCKYKHTHSLYASSFTRTTLS